MVFKTKNGTDILASEGPYNPGSLSVKEKVGGDLVLE